MHLKKKNQLLQDCYFMQLHAQKSHSAVIDIWEGKCLALFWDITSQSKNTLKGSILSGSPWKAQHKMGGRHRPPRDSLRTQLQKQA